MNADLGEGAPTDAALLEIITSANVACGGHAGDDESMRRVIRTAVAQRVGIGAHPSYPDREGFGRRVISISRDALIDTLGEQIRRLAMLAEEQGAAVRHVKAHGALYNVAVDDEDIARVIGEAMRLVNPDLIAVALAGSRMASIFREQGLLVAEEAFIDRGYTAAGTLVSRSDPRALVTDPGLAAERAVRMAKEGVVAAVDGTVIPARAHTLCIHADTPGSPALAKAARTALEAAGISVMQMSGA